MRQIQDLLSKYAHIFPQEELVRDALTDILKKANISLERTAITFLGGIARINAHPSVKNKIFRLRGAIKRDLKDRLGDRAPSDVQ